MKASDFQCSKCGRGPVQDRAIIHQFNGVWLCDHCLSPEQRATLDPELMDLLSTFQQDQLDKDAIDTIADIMRDVVEGTNDYPIDEEDQ